MKQSDKKRCFLCFLTFLALLFSTAVLPAAAETVTEDGKYEVQFDSDMPSMGLSAFENKEKKAVVEKIGEQWYFTLSVNADVVSHLTLQGGSAKVGEMVRTEGQIERHTYTVTAGQLSEGFRFSTRVTAMDRTVTFSVSPKMDTALRVGDADDRGERPALFVPTIETAASDGEMEKGSSYRIPAAKATLGDKTLPVSVKAYYLENGVPKEVKLKDNQLVFASIGDYLLVFRAESDSYQTSLGHNTYAEVTVRFLSKVGAGTVAKMQDVNHILEAGTQIQASILQSGPVFETAAEKMKGFADRFEVIEVELFKSNGEAVNLSGEIALSLRADDTFNRKEIKVFYLGEDGSLTEYQGENFGRYVKLNTAKTGTYILCVEGVAFHMPVWGYALILLGSVALIAAIVVTAVVMRKRKQEKH